MSYPTDNKLSYATTANTCVDNPLSNSEHLNPAASCKNTANSNAKPATKSKVNKYAWVVVAMNALFLFYKYVLQVSPSVMTDDLMRQFHVTGAGLGNLAATYFYTYLVTQLFAGPLLDRYSPRLLTAGAVLVCAMGMFGFAHATSLHGAQFFRGMVGVGAAFATVSYLKLAANWFSAKRYATVAGLLASAVGVGALVGQTPLAMMVQNSGWRNTLTDCAWVGVVVAVLYLLFVRNRPAANNTSDATTSTDHAATNKNTSTRVSWKHMLNLLKNKRNWWLTLYSGLAFSPLAVWGGLWGTPFLQTAHQLSKTQSAELVTLAFVGLGLGAPLFGWLSDKVNRRLSVMASGTVLSALALLVVVYYTGNSMSLLSLAVFLFGFGTGSFMLGFAVGKEMNPLMLAGCMVAMVNSGDALFGATTEPLVGRMLDYFWDGRVVHGVHYFSSHDYRLAFTLLPLYLVASLYCVRFLRTEKTMLTHK